MTIRFIEPPITKEDFEEISKTHIRLVEKLHENMDLIPEKLKGEIWDDVYAHFVP